MILIMLGAPASGKGTVAGLLSEGLNIPAVSSGDIFRKAIADKTELGKEVSGYLERGALVPDELTIRVIEARLNEPDLANGIILDGFPRTTAQAEELDRFLNTNGKKIDMAINLETPRDELIERVVNRRVCSNQECKTIFNVKLHPPKVDGICDKCGSALIQRKDDNEEVMNSRLDTYFKETAPIIDFYKDKGILRTFKVSESIGYMGVDVAKDLINEFKK